MGEKYDFCTLHEYFAKNGIKNSGKNIKIEWVTDTTYNKNIKIIDFDKVIWSLDKIMRRDELRGLMKEIEDILKDTYKIYTPVKVMTTVDDINKSVESFHRKRTNKLKLKVIPKKANEIKEVNKPASLVFSKTYGKDMLPRIPNVYATVARDDDVYEENEKRVVFNEIVGFRVYNKEKNIAICLDFWKDDEKIVLRLADKNTGKISKVLFQKSIDEILREVSGELQRAKAPLLQGMKQLES
jgi:hypothetical protein